MINWEQILTSENFKSSPVPHFRIYNLLPDDIHSKLYQDYDTVWDKLIHPTGIWKKSMDIDNPLWEELFNHCWDTGEIVKDYWCKHTDTELTPTETLNVNLSKHFFCNHPGELLRDWHLDGTDKNLSYIYYLGMGDETHGGFEFRCPKTNDILHYPYTANSLTIWNNDDVSFHRFYQANRERKTLYSAFT